MYSSLLFSVAEGGESCLTSGDRREPEDSDVYIKPLPPRSALPSEGEEEGWGGGRYSSGSFQSPEVKHNSPPLATSEHSLLSIGLSSAFRLCCSGLWGLSTMQVVI